MMTYTGKFITFEGGEGAGKTTVIEAVRVELERRGFDVVVTREPGGTPIAEKIREVILDVGHTEMAAKTEVLLYAAARAQHVEELVIPSLHAGKIVLCDRFVDSSLVYQAYARDIGFDIVYKLNAYSIGEYWPQATILLDIIPEVGLKRVFSNRDASEINRLDQEALSFHEAVYEGYQDLAKRFAQRFRIVDASRDVEMVIRETITIVDQVLADGE
ncbi:MAG: dTMP kinase [Culicoidibacterales bacterium]